MAMTKRYITTAIPYINAEPHIGFLLELLSGDILARYYRQLGDDTFFLTGTDEHGAKVAKVAAEAGEKPQDYANRLAGRYQELIRLFGVENNFFIRTTDERHKAFVQEKWRELSRAGLLEKRHYKARYCFGCEAFKTDREVVDGCCSIHNQPLELVEEDNWFFKLSQFKEPILEWIDSGAILPASRAKEVRNTVAELEDVSVSRSKEKVSWGVQVPDDPSQVMYVWTDALLNYISALAICHQEDRWPADAQIIGKDILRFHAAIWPGLLLALKLPLPKRLLVHGFVNVDNQKISKSLGNVVTPKQLLERYGSYEAVRYLMFRQLAFFSDSNFTWSDFDALYNGELVNGLGNLVSRIIGLRGRAALGSYEADRRILLEKQRERLRPQLEKGLVDFQEELSQVSQLVRQCDQLISRQKIWEAPQESKKQRALQEATKRLAEIAVRLEPYMPNTAQRILQRLAKLEAGVLFERLRRG